MSALALGFAAASAQSGGPAPNRQAPDDADTLAAITALEANALFETGDTDEARAAAQAALVLDPENQTALTVLAMSGEHAPDWREAVAAWDDVARIGEDTKAAANARIRADEIARRDGAFARLDAFFFGEPDEDEQIGLAASGRIAREQGPSILLGLESRQFDADIRPEPLAPPAGGAAIPSPNIIVDENRVTGRLGVEFYPDFGRTALQVIGNGDVNGLLASVDRQGRDHLIRFEAAYNRPYYDFGQAVSRDAAVDELRLTGGRTIGRVFLDGRLGVRNYTIDDREDAAESTLLSAGASYRFGDTDTAFRVAARFDGEFVSGERTIDRPAGPPIRAIPIRDLQIASIGAYRRFEPGGSDHTYFDIGAGYREDFESEGGPFVRAEGALRLTPDITLSLNAEYTDVATQRANSEAFTFVTVSLTRTFPTMGRRT